MTTDAAENAPAVKQKVLLTHDTFAKLLESPVPDVAIKVQLDPFQRAANGWPAPLELVVPTARQNVALEHDTSQSEAKEAPAGVGFDMTAHAVPFHRSTSVRTFPLPGRYEPTAKQFDALTHERASTLIV